MFQTLFILAAIITSTTVFCVYSGRIYQAGYAATPISEITDSGLDLACEWRLLGLDAAPRGGRRRPARLHVLQELTPAFTLHCADLDQKPVRCYVIVGWLAWASSCVGYVLASVAARRELRAATAGERLAEHPQVAEVTKA